MAYTHYIYIKIEVLVVLAPLVPVWAVEALAPHAGIEPASLRSWQSVRG